MVVKYNRLIFHSLTLKIPSLHNLHRFTTAVPQLHSGFSVSLLIHCFLYSSAKLLYWPFVQCSQLKSLFLFFSVHIAPKVLQRLY